MSEHSQEKTDAVFAKLKADPFEPLRSAESGDASGYLQAGLQSAEGSPHSAENLAEPVICPVNKQRCDAVQCGYHPYPEIFCARIEFDIS